MGEFFFKKEKSLSARKIELYNFILTHIPRFFVNAPERGFEQFLFNLSFAPSIICIHLYGSTSISLVVKVLVGFCGMAIGLSNPPFSLGREWPSNQQKIELLRIYYSNQGYLIGSIFSIACVSGS